MIKPAIQYLALGLSSVLFLFPLAWMIGRALGAPHDIGINYFTQVWSSELFGRYFLNSLIVSASITILNLLLCSMGGFYLARYQSIFSKSMFWTIILTLVVPVPVLMIPLYLVISALGWLDTYWALILPWAVTPLGLFLMKQYFEKMPVSIEESARMDGAGDYAILFRIVMPMSRPALAVLGIYTFIQSWNQFLFPFLLVDSAAMRTLPVGLAFFHSYQDISVAGLMAGAGIASIPMIAVFLLFQRQIIAGLTQGALKE